MACVFAPADFERGLRCRFPILPCLGLLSLLASSINGDVGLEGTKVVDCGLGAVAMSPLLGFSFLSPGSVGKGVCCGFVLLIFFGVTLMGGSFILSSVSFEWFLILVLDDMGGSGIFI